jgi:hypothetical protein
MSCWHPAAIPGRSFQWNAGVINRAGLESASVRQDIRPFAAFIGELIRRAFLQMLDLAFKELSK